MDFDCVLFIFIQILTLTLVNFAIIIPLFVWVRKEMNKDIILLQTKIDYLINKNKQMFDCIKEIDACDMIDKKQKTKKQQ